MKKLLIIIPVALIFLSAVIFLIGRFGGIDTAKNDTTSAFILSKFWKPPIANHLFVTYPESYWIRVTSLTPEVMPRVCSWSIYKNGIVWSMQVREVEWEDFTVGDTIYWPDRYGK
ncbi:hypothetical protein LCGC14_1461410 [marine sediment metagenome]|uniref:Uncharacterized protein n=1 Tax=marine sediment metagenome TaxID=412755 RepID=A0A0F9LVL2_9ZZZZ